MKNRMEREALLELLRLCFKTADEKRLKRLLCRCDMGTLERLIAHSGVAGLLYATCKEKPYFPDSLLSFLLQSSGAAAIKNEFIKQELLTIADVFSKNNIEYFVVKGIPMVERLYPDLSCRVVTDIDMMVKKQQYGRASLLLEEMDFHYPIDAMQRVSDVYSKEWVEQQMREILYVKDALPFQILVDVHQEMNLFRDNETMNSLYPLDEHDWFANVTLHEMDGQQVACLSYEFALLHMVYHFTIEHSFIGLKWLVDICQLLGRYGKTLDWDRLDTAVQNKNLRRLVGLCLALSSEIIGKESLTEAAKRGFVADGQRGRRLYVNMLFEEYGSMRSKIYNKFLKVTFPAAAADRRKVLRYYLFDKSSIDHRTGGKAHGAPKILQPFVLLGIVFGDLRKKKKKESEKKPQ